MEDAQLDILASFGQALWADPQAFEKVAAETVAAVSLMDLTEDRAIERISSVLLQRALRGENSAGSAFAHQAFFRMLPEERFILTALHQGHWSYARLARVMEKTPDEIAEIAWSARLHLAVHAPTPMGSRRSESCPDYHPRRPWTQRFLDRELISNEQMFFQSHLEGCDSCRQSLARSRAIYYVVDAIVPRAPAADASLRLYGAARRQAGILRGTESHTFRESLAIFLQGRDIQVMLLVLAMILIVTFLR